jgi:hypothetical protein
MIKVWEVLGTTLKARLPKYFFGNDADQGA